MRPRHHIGLQRHPLPPDRSWFAQSLHSARWDRFLHCHDCWELLAIEEGACSYHIAGFSAGASGPTAFLFAPGVEHTLFTDGFLPNGKVIKGLVLWMSAHLVDLLVQLPEGRFLAPLTARAALGIQFTNWFSNKALDILNHSERAEDTSQLGSIFTALHVLSQGRHWQIGTLAPALHHDPDGLALITRLDDWLHTHFDQDIHLPEASVACAVSISTLNAALKRHCNCTFLDYLNRVRIDHARTLLEHGTPITQAAFAAGFQSLATFHRRFRTSVGLSPVAWLAARRDDHPDPLVGAGRMRTTRSSSDNSV